MSEELIIPASLATTLSEVVPQLEKGRVAGLTVLNQVQKVEDEEQLRTASELIVKGGMVLDKMVKIRKTVTERLDQAKQQLMAPEKEISAEYDRARKVVDDYNQKKLQEKKRIEAEAEAKKALDQHKADIRAGVRKQLLDMMIGQEKNITQGMIQWEASLTLETIDAREASLKLQNPSLKKEKYDGCFNMDFPGRRFNEVDMKVLLDEIKVTETYEKYNEQYKQMVAPILNAYRAKISQIKTQLVNQKKAGEEEKAKMEAKRQEELKKQNEEAILKIDTKAEEKKEEITHEQEMSKMESEFQKQGTVQDLEAPPVKRILKFKDGQFIKPMQEIIAKSASHGKFPGIYKKGKSDYIEAVDWWLKFYAANYDDAPTGMELTEVAKTIIKA